MAFCGFQEPQFCAEVAEEAAYIRSIKQLEHVLAASRSSESHIRQETEKRLQILHEQQLRLERELKAAKAKLCDLQRCFQTV